jgi:hypothetical protein
LEKGLLSRVYLKERGFGRKYIQPLSEELIFWRTIEIGKLIGSYAVSRSFLALPAR